MQAKFNLKPYLHQIIMSEFQQKEEDFVLKKFLNFLDQDMKKNPKHIKPISSDLIKRVQFLTDGIEVKALLN